MLMQQLMHGKDMRLADVSDRLPVCTCNTFLNMARVAHHIVPVPRMRALAWFGTCHIPCLYRNYAIRIWITTQARPSCPPSSQRWRVESRTPHRITSGEFAD